MFYDYVKIYVKGGDGGNGSAAFRREKYVPNGGPAGGDGGRGGDVVFIGDDNMTTLVDFKFRQHYRGDRGGNGMSKNMHGKNAPELLVKVPVGTIIRDDTTKELIADVTQVGQRVVVASAGRGGRGNCRFVTAKNRTPEYAENGEPGQERWLRLELKLLADVGLLGMPSAGKSTIISKVSGSRPKIADYPFTTLVPNLGVVTLEPGCSFVLADVPGLIEGAAEGAGLGHRFLRHVERTRLLIHVLDMSEQPDRTPITDFEVINKELAKYRADLLERPQIIAANKMDSEGAEERLAEFKAKYGDQYEIYPISALMEKGLDPLMWRAYDILQQTPVAAAVEAEEEKITKVENVEGFTVRRDIDGQWRVEGEKVEKLVKMTDWENDAAVARLAHILTKIGVEDACRKAGAKDGDVIRIADQEFDFAD